jgi:hypothetical protein
MPRGTRAEALVTARSDRACHVARSTVRDVIGDRRFASVGGVVVAVEIAEPADAGATPGCARCPPTCIATRAAVRGVAIEIHRASVGPGIRVREARWVEWKQGRTCCFERADEHHQRNECEARAPRDASFAPPADQLSPPCAGRGFNP